ncbi:MAG TPA: glycoside hydrolase family 43 protein [Chitinophagaceae bacterium]|nr:glycoside hydrolase family 43 protein [Chitinophagaceae bacterium]
MKQFMLIIFLFSSFSLRSQERTDSVYMFSYFVNNGEDGLHFAYSRDGLQYKLLNEGRSFLQPTVANDKLMRDPCIIRGADGMFHMVWTVSWNDKGIGYASSKDLRNWSEQRFIPVMAHEDSARNTWAPEITYDPYSKQYMIYWASTVKGKFPETTASESKYNHRIYYTLTKDFRSFSHAKLLYNGGFNVIDASIIVLGPRNYLMFLKDETLVPVAKKNIRIARSRHLNKGYGEAGTPITGKYWAEGPTSCKVNDRWVVLFDKYTEGRYGAVASKNFTNWEDISHEISVPHGLRHGTVLLISAGEFRQFFGDLN